MSLRPVAVLRRGRARAGNHPRRPRLSNCGLRRAGRLRGGRARGADGRCGPGSSASLGRYCQLRRPPMARRGGYRHCRISVPAVQRGGQAPGRGRSPPPLAPCRPHHRRNQTALRLPRKCRPSSPPRFPRSRQRTGRPGLQAYGRPLHGGGSRCAPSARAAVHPRHPRGRRAGRPRAPAPGSARAAATGRKCCASGPRRWPWMAANRVRATAGRPI